MAFGYDLTEYLKKDGTTNVLAVRVDDSAEPSVRWYAGAGIYRHVRLITTGYTHFRLDGGISITTPEITNEQAVVNIDYTIDPNFFSYQEFRAWAKDPWQVKLQSKNIVLRSSILALDGTIIKNHRVDSHTVKACSQINSPHKR